MLNRTGWPQLVRASRLVALALWLGWMALGPPAPAHALSLTAATEAELNAAIAAVNAAGAGNHAVSLTADITLTAALPPLVNGAATELLIDGDGHTLTGDGAHTVLRVTPGTTARLRDLAITGGRGDSGPADNSGGAIYNAGRLTVVNCTLRGNSAAAGGAIAGAALSEDSWLTISDSTLSDNTATTFGGGLFVIANAGQMATVTLTNVTVTRNTASTLGGGAHLIAGPQGEVEATITNARFEDNTAFGSGGGLLASVDDGDLSLDIVGSTLVNNTGGGVAQSVTNGGVGETRLLRTTVAGNTATTGAGVYNWAGSGGTAGMTLFNATLSGNRAGQSGGGLTVASDGGSAGANVVYSTLAGNTAPSGGGGVHVASAAGSPAAVTLNTTIITNGAGAGPDCARPSGSLISIGYNLAGDGTCFLNQGNDLPASPAGLLPLAVNAPGGPPTHALLAGSRARNRIHPGGAGCGTAITVDQRGAPRPQPAGGRCDVGAFESQPGDPAGWGVYLPAVRNSGQ